MAKSSVAPSGPSPLSSTLSGMPFQPRRCRQASSYKQASYLLGAPMVPGLNEQVHLSGASLTVCRNVGEPLPVSSSLLLSILVTLLRF